MKSIFSQAFAFLYVHNVREDVASICVIPQSTFHGSDGSWLMGRCIEFVRGLHIYIFILEKSVGIDIRLNRPVGLGIDDGLDVGVDEVVVGFEVLFDQSFDLEKSRQ